MFCVISFALPCVLAQSATNLDGSGGLIRGPGRAPIEPSRVFIPPDLISPDFERTIGAGFSRVVLDSEPDFWPRAPETSQHGRTGKSRQKNKPLYRIPYLSETHSFTYPFNQTAAAKYVLLHCTHSSQSFYYKSTPEMLKTG